MRPHDIAVACRRQCPGNVAQVFVEFAELRLAEPRPDQPQQRSCPLEALAGFMNASFRIAVALQTNDRIRELFSRYSAHALDERLLQLQSIRHMAPCADALNVGGRVVTNKSPSAATH
jgi:hypothetical protein